MNRITLDNIPWDPNRFGGDPQRLLPPALLEPLYRMGWRTLYPAQCAALSVILREDRDLVIAAGTATGKTEAAFLPILADYLRRKPQNIQTPTVSPGLFVLAICPLRALIDDQFQRMELLCTALDVAVHRWHAEVSPSAKDTLLDNPSGIAFITPESLESLFINRPSHLEALFRNLAYVVIDELHAFVGTERGAQLKSLLLRLRRRFERAARVRWIGLSATLGDPDRVRTWLRPEAPESIAVIAQSAGSRVVKIRVHTLIEEYNNIEPADELSPEEDLREIQAGRVARTALDRFAGRSVLIFGDSKAWLEEIAGRAKAILHERGMPDRVYLHHASLATADRRETEAALRSGQPATVFCSPTLELGIDLGYVYAIGLVSPPRRIAILTQRLGRSGRREGEPAVLRIFYAPWDNSQKMYNRFDACVSSYEPDFLMTCAILDLFLERKCEPPETDTWHGTALVQQILSCIAERGEIKADALYDLLVTHGAFQSPLLRITDFAAVLRSLGKSDLIEQTPGAGGGLILGLAGERLVRHREFYAVFTGKETFQVRTEQRVLGTLPLDADLLDKRYIRLSGRLWLITELDKSQRIIMVRLVPADAAATVPAAEILAPGDQLDSYARIIHQMVRERMRDIAQGTHQPAYLDAAGQALLARIRSTTAAAAKAAKEPGPFVRGDGTFCWFTWTSTAGQRALVALTRRAGLTPRDEGIALAFPANGPDGVPNADALRTRLAPLMQNPPTPQELANMFPVWTFQKYDALLPENLLAAGFVHNHLDLNLARDRIFRDLNLGPS